MKRSGQSLDREWAAYVARLPELRAQSFVLIKGDDVVATFDSYADALSAGYPRFQSGAVSGEADPREGPPVFAGARFRDTDPLSENFVIFERGNREVRALS